MDLQTSYESVCVCVRALPTFKARLYCVQNTPMPIPTSNPFTSKTTPSFTPTHLLGGVEAQQLGHAVAVGGVFHDTQLHGTPVLRPELAEQLARLAGGGRLIFVCDDSLPQRPL